MQLFQMIRGGGNPISFLQSMAPNNQEVMKVCQFIQGKDPNEFMGIAENLARAKGIDINQMKQQIMQQFGMGM